MRWCTALGMPYARHLQSGRGGQHVCSRLAQGLAQRAGGRDNSCNGAVGTLVMEALMEALVGAP
jgi:hypothetical protein